MNKFFNEIFVSFYKWIELDLNLDMKEVKLMFDLLIAKDRKFIRHCPEDIENDIFVIEKVINKSTISEQQQKQFKNFISCCIDCYNFDKVKNKKQDIRLDLLYYKAALAQYYIFNLKNIKTFISFKKEFYQIGVQIGTFYKIQEQNEREVIGKMIKSKTLELFKRFNFNYILPLCCN